MKDLRTIFMGSPDFSIPTLQKLINTTNVLAVVTQPDRPAGRGRAPAASAVKVFAEENRIPILQPEKISSDAALESISLLEPDILVVTAYGQIIRKNLLNLPRYGCINVHASLLPRWRGASPIQAAILAGDTSTGVTIMLMDQGLDTGPILSQEAIPIPASATGGEMFTILSHAGADLLIPTLRDFTLGKIAPLPQDDKHSTYAPMLKKDDGRLDFTNTADRLSAQVRAYEPWPGSFFYYQNRRVVVRQAHSISETRLSPGIPFSVNQKPAISCSDGSLVLDEVQPSGKNRMPSDSFLHGAKDFFKANFNRSADS
ncbi:MAG: methionyl-tRNA formyltransferase [Anaerolineales bacterium]|nr:methionyl-tRNA formyltransferase [Anaerolineales bacterium]